MGSPDQMRPPVWLFDLELVSWAQHSSASPNRKKNAFSILKASSGKHWEVGPEKSNSRSISVKNVAEPYLDARDL